MPRNGSEEGAEFWDEACAAWAVEGTEAMQKWRQGPSPSGRSFNFRLPTWNLEGMC